LSPVGFFAICKDLLEAREILRRSLAKLPRGYQTVFLMREVGLMTTLEVAGCLGMRQNYVRLKLHRAPRMLQRISNHDCQ
jgi:DNA-directed RNA polymerase specialized sigma24 family protein